MAAGNKSLIIEFDNAVIDGTQLLFDLVSERFAALDGIKVDTMTEARYLLGREYLEGVTELFKSVKTKKTAVKAARELGAAYVEALKAAMPKALTQAFQNFLTAITDRGVGVMLMTRVPTEAATELLAPVLNDKVRVCLDTSSIYGATDWVSWRRACAAGGFDSKRSLAVAGAGISAKAAMMGALTVSAVIHPHVEYHDFGGACLTVDALNGKTVKRFLKALRLS